MRKTRVRLDVILWSAIAAVFFAVMLGASIRGTIVADSEVLFAAWLADSVASAIAIVIVVSFLFVELHAATKGRR